METAHMVDCVKRYINANANHKIEDLEVMFDEKNGMSVKISGRPPRVYL